MLTGDKWNFICGARSIEKLQFKAHQRLAFLGSTKDNPSLWTFFIGTTFCIVFIKVVARPKPRTCQCKILSISTLTLFFQEPHLSPFLSLSLSVCLYRDIMSIYKEPPPGMFVVPDPQDMTKVKGRVSM